MREIKFRGYCDRDSEWRYGYYITDGKIHEINTLLRDDKTLYGSQIDIESLGQYTGLKDKNGIEIYEGDICRCWGGSEFNGYYEYNKIYEVKWQGSGLEMMIGDCGYGWNYSSAFEHIEVIGNIYENLELLRED